MAKKKRKFNAYGVMLRRGNPCGDLHAEIVQKVVTALAELGPQWYDHIVVPTVPATFQPVPLAVPHFSPTPDIVVCCRNHGNELYMIHIQHVKTLKKGEKTALPYYDREKEEQHGNETTVQTDNGIATQASDSKHKGPKPGDSNRQESTRPDPIRPKVRQKKTTG